MITELNHLPEPSLLAAKEPAQKSSRGISPQESFRQQLAAVFGNGQERQERNPTGFSMGASSGAAGRQISVTRPEDGSPSSVTGTEGAKPEATREPATYPKLSADKLTLPPNAPDDAYWSQQPAAVQQLRYMPKESDRQKLAEQLAGQGYSIDVPVMVWGWDAGETMSLRQSYGYTWVPSANNAPIQEAPGIQMPGLTAYNPNNPPPGSILVPSGATQG